MPRDRLGDERIRNRDRVVTSASPEPATLPPSGLPGLDAEWSRLVTARDAEGIDRTWHVLDTGATEETSLTLLCVHGNPTWSYVWRSVLGGAPKHLRVVAVDQLDMGFSERTGTERRLERRIDDLSSVVDALGIDTPIITVAHDWGGPISIGWAQRHRKRLAGMVLMNTAVHQPEDARAPSLIRAVRTPGILDQVAVRSTGFVRGTTALIKGRTDRAVKSAYLAPYRTASRRTAIGFFVSDIPLEDDHPSAAALDAVADGLDDMADVPVLLLWGPSDPVFSDLYLHDLEDRLPDADVHRFVGASHLLPEDVDVATPIFDWIAARDRTPQQSPRTTGGRRAWEAIEGLAESDDVAVVEMVSGGEPQSISFRELAAEVRRVGSGLRAIGVGAGDRVALMIPPGLELSVCLYACWRIGAVVVVADAGLGVRGIGRALRSADPDYIIGVPRALAAARAMGWPGVRIGAGAMSPSAARMVGATYTLAGLPQSGVESDLPDPPHFEAPAAVAFTSGATGPAKGVAYRHGQLDAQRAALESLYGIGPDDSLVAAFPPFSLFGPAMGIPSVVPVMEVTSPGTLEASALADAARAVDATLVFASPSALANVLATADALSPAQREALGRIRLLLSAGAPVPRDTLEALRSLMPKAEAHTPYGMTETLPVADITLEGINGAGPGLGVCVGPPLHGVEVMIDPLDEVGDPVGKLTDEPDVSGEVCVRAAHMKDEYDRLWHTQHRSATPPGWHRSGDVGHFDEQRRLWIEGRLVHAIATADGVLTPLALEQRFASAEGVRAAAAVGVGTRGDERVVAIVVPDEPPSRPALGLDPLASDVRSTVDVDVAAVLVVPELPVDKRHNAKVDRLRLRRWAASVLAGNRIGKP
ncbi:MAG: alpha/beta fold hydrolase [Acidimicrobiia bacterium]|nr:alpha/beta fold hydrolase [Acidimicrobiia bacterium]